MSKLEFYTIEQGSCIHALFAWQLELNYVDITIGTRHNDMALLLGMLHNGHLVHLSALKHLS
jgi:hypothetical protein